MWGIVESYLLPHWSATPANTNVLLGIEPDRAFLNEGEMMTKGGRVIVKCRAIPYNVQKGVRGVALRIPEFALLTTDDSTEPEARYSAAFFDPQDQSKALMKWQMFGNFILPHRILRPEPIVEGKPDESASRRGRVTWEAIYVANLPEDARRTYLGGKYAGDPAE